MAKDRQDDHDHDDANYGDEDGDNGDDRSTCVLTYKILNYY